MCVKKNVIMIYNMFNSDAGPLFKDGVNGIYNLGVHHFNKPLEKDNNKKDNNKKDNKTDKQLVNPSGVRRPFVIGHEQFKDKHNDSDSAYFLLIYANWCPHCHTLKPVLENIMSHLAPYGMRLGAVEATANPEYDSVVPNVDGFPTLFIIHNNKVHKYMGNRTEFDIVDKLHQILNDM
jgi:thiol-disulfide isomerase/thioredoxin